MFIRKFIAAWLADWTGRMSGFASIVLTFWATFFPPNIDKARWALLIAGIVCFVFGSYHIWAKEHKALLAEQAAKLLPELLGELKHYENGCVNGRGVNSAFFLFLNIRNIGTLPTIIRDWSFFVDTPDKSLQAVPILFDGELRLGLENGQILVVNSVDRIDNKHADTPIPMGGQATGFIAFILNRTL